MSATEMRRCRPCDAWHKCEENGVAQPAKLENLVLDTASNVGDANAANAARLLSRFKAMPAADSRLRSKYRRMTLLGNKAVKSSQSLASAPANAGFIAAILAYAVLVKRRLQPSY